METLRDSIEIKATPEKVYNQLVQYFQSKENYQSWHPDHVDIRWIDGEPMQEGSTVYAEEYLHGELHKLKFVITKVVPNKQIEYKPPFPLSIFAPGNSFILEFSGDNHCIFTALARYRAGPLFRKLAKKQIEATIKHIREEGEKLKIAVEKAGN